MKDQPVTKSTLQAPIIPLWEDGQLDLSGSTQSEEIFQYTPDFRVIRNVSRPTLTAYLPDPGTANGTAVIICPGGAYHFLAYEHEGIQVAEWLNAHGIAAFVLKYRLVQTGDDFPQCVDENLNDPQKMASRVEPVFPLIQADGCQAIRLVKAHAAEWQIDPERVGILGFSAGGMLSLMVAHHFDDSSRPAFVAPIYSAPPPAAPVPVDAPPLFLLCAADDEMAREVSLEMAPKWSAAGRPVELHLYSRGGHGFGMLSKGLPSDRWIERFYDWLRAEGLLS